MTITCPACRKANSMVPTPAPCARCAADLSRLWAVCTAASQALDEARQALRQGRWGAALAAATRSWSLRHQEAAAGMAFLAAAAAGQTGAACTWLRRCRRVETDGTAFPAPTQRSPQGAP